MSVRHYRELIAWQKAMDLVVLLYKATAKFPREELFGLTSQVRRAAISVPSNLAEGQGRGTTQDFIRFITIARGSLQEVETQILLAERLTYLDAGSAQDILALSAEVSKIIAGLYKSLSDNQ